MTKQKLIGIGKQKTESDNTSAEEVKFQGMSYDNKLNNSLKNRYNALLDVIGKERVTQKQQTQNYKIDYDTIRNYQPEKSDLRKQVEGMVDKIQRKLKEEEGKFQQMQQTNQKNANGNYNNNKYQQFLMTKMNKDARINQTLNRNNSSNGMSQKRDETKYLENYQQQNQNQQQQNGNVTTYGVTLQQKENMINKKTEQFFYNACNQNDTKAKLESSQNLETSLNLNLLNNNYNNNKNVPNFSAANTQSYGSNLLQTNLSQSNHERNSSREDSPNIFRVKKIKQNNLIEIANRFSRGGGGGEGETLEDLAESLTQFGNQDEGERYDGNRFVRNHDETLRMNRDKRYSPKRVIMPQNQINKMSNSGGVGVGLANTNNPKTFYNSDSNTAFMNTTTNNFGNGVFLSKKSNTKIASIIQSSSQPVLLTVTNNTKQYQSTVNQMDQLERIVYKLRGQQQKQQEMIRSSSNPSTRLQMARNKEINRVNSEKSFRQKDISQNMVIAEREELKSSNRNEELKSNNRNETSPPQNVIFKPFTTQNMNFSKLKNIKIPTMSNSKEQSTTIDGVLGSSSSFKGSIQNLDRFEIGQVIGQGSYAVVRKAKDVLTDRIVAIKIYDKFRLIDPQKRNNVKREMHILQKLDHKNIIQLLMTVDTRTTVNLVMEYMGSLSLRHFLKSKPNHRLPEPEAKIIFKQILSAVNYCHSNDVIHRDLKLENILISEETNEIKLIDFGFSIKAANDKKLNMFCGTASYMSPELVQQQDYLGKQTDIWALGVLLFVLLQGRFPFKGKDDSELFKKICKNEYKLGSDVSIGASNLIKSIMKVNPLERPTTKTILKDTWLNQP